MQQQHGSCSSGGGAGASFFGAAAGELRARGVAGRDSVIPMDALGEPYQRLARHDKLGGAVQATARLLDTTAASASHIIRQYPLARLAVFGYLLLIHLFLYLVIARLQRQAIAAHLTSGAHP